MVDRENVINKVTAIVADMQEEVDEWKDYSDSELRGGLTCDCDWWYKTLQTLKDALALLKAQEPRLVTEADFENADPYGYLPVWVEDKDDSEIICDCITKHAITDPDEDYHYRYWTSRPDEKRRAETPWRS